MKSVRKLKRTVHKMIPHRWYRVIPMDELKQMYKRRFKKLVKSKRLWENIFSGVGSSVFGLVFIWLLFFGI